MERSMQYLRRNIFLATLLLFACVALLGCQSIQIKSTPEIAPSLSPKVSPSQTVTPGGGTITPIVTSLPQNQNIDGPFLLEYNLGGDIYLQEIATGRLRKLNSIYKILPEEGFLGWTRNSCSFYIRLDNHNIVEINLAGDVIRQVYNSKNQFQSKDDYISPWVKISPDEKYIAYFVGNGPRNEVEGFGYLYQKEDLLVDLISGDGSPIEISRHGGARNFGWSVDGKSIIFTDYDVNEQLQIYISSLENKTLKQLSKFMEQSNIPNNFIWSNDNRFVAVIYAYQRPWQIVVYDIVKSTQTFTENVDNVWWNDDGTLTILVNNNLSWVDPKKGTIIKNINLPQFILIPRSWNGVNQLACLGDCLGERKRMLIIYDVVKGDITKFPQVTPIPDLMGWYKSSSLFPGESICK